MPTIRVEYPDEEGKPLTTEYPDVDAVVDAAKTLTLVQHGVVKGGLTLDVIVAEFPEGRYLRYETVGDAGTATRRMGMPPPSTHTMGVTPLAPEAGFVAPVMTDREPKVEG